MAAGDTIASGFNPSTFSLGCGFTRTDESVYEQADATGEVGAKAIDGKYNIYFRRRSRDTKTYEENYFLYTEGSKAQYLTDAVVANFDMVEFILCTNTAATITEAAVTGLIDKESVPIIADGSQGAEGTSPWVADSNNEMDSVSCDDMGYAVAEQTVETVVALYHGSTEEMFAIDRSDGMKRNSTAMTWNSSTNRWTATGIEVTYNSSNRKVSVKYGTTAKISGKDVYTITLTNSENSITRELKFTVNGIVGDVYNLKPSVDDIHADRSGTDYVVNGSSTYDLRCGYTKKVDGVISTPSTDVTAQIDSKYNVYFRRHIRNGDWEKTGLSYVYYLYTHTTYKTYVTGLDLNTYDAVEFVLCKETDDYLTKDDPDGVIDRETVYVLSNGIMGENSIRLSLDNEHEDFLYSDSQVRPIAPSGGAKSVIHLYNGQSEETLTTDMLRIDSSSSGVPGSGDYMPSIIADTDGKIKLKVPHITANTAKVVVKATYNGHDYYADFTANKTTQDKYDLTLKPNAIAFNASDTWSNKTITPSADRTDLQGNKTTDLAIQTSEVSGLRLYYSYVDTDGSLVTPSLNRCDSTLIPFILKKTPANTYIGIYFELRLYSGDSYRMCDYETVEIAKSQNGAPGTGQPDYIQTEEAWSDVESVENDTTEPVPNGGWSDTTPTNPNNYAYLWRRSRKMVLKDDGTYGKAPSPAGDWKYSRLSGTNGTSIKTKGTIAVAITASGTWPTSGFSTGDIGIKQGDGTPYKATVTSGVASWSKSSMSAADDGDSYTVTKDCTIDLDGDGTSENIKGHLIMWSSEASKWIDLGQFKGDNGSSSYIHIAWCNVLGTGTNWTDQNTGFTTAKADTDVYKYMGTLVNHDGGSDPDVTHAGDYSWNEIKGAKGDDGKYYVDDYKRYDSHLANASGTPAGNTDMADWTTSVPLTTNQYKYIWKRTRLCNPNTTPVSYGTATYVCLTGAAGATGAMYYMMGLYDSTATYVRNTSTVPLVYYDNGSGAINPYTGTTGAYWYVKDGVTTVPAGSAPSDNSEYWQKADSFGVVITSGIFADFAKLGAAVMSGDYMFSTNGMLDGTNYSSGANWKGRPAYTLFAGDPSEYTIDILSAANINTTTYKVLHNPIAFEKGKTVVLKFSVITKQSNTNVALFKADGSQPVDIEYSYGTTNAWNNDDYFSITNNTTYYIRFTPDSTDSYVLKAQRANGSGINMVSFSLTRMLFEPNWWVDLLSGKMSAARGNFVVKPNGDVEAIGIKAIDGDFSGNLNAKTIYYNVLHFIDGGIYDMSNGKKWYYLHYKPTLGYGNADLNFETEEEYNEAVAYWANFTVGNYYDMSLYPGDPLTVVTHNQAEMKVFIPCSYDADKIVMLPVSIEYKWTRAVPVYLPDPSQFPGKQVEVVCKAEQGDVAVEVGCINNGKIAIEAYYNNGLMKVANNAEADKVVIYGAHYIKMFNYTGTQLGLKLVSSRAVFYSRKLTDSGGTLRDFWLRLE